MQNVFIAFPLQLPVLSLEGKLDGYLFIAGLLDISVNTIEQHIRKALHFLSKSVYGYNGAAISVLICTLPIF